MEPFFPGAATTKAKQRGGKWRCDCCEDSLGRKPAFLFSLPNISWLLLPSLTAIYASLMHLSFHGKMFLLGIERLEERKRKETERVIGEKENEKETLC